MSEQGRTRKRARGVVQSDKMDKSVTVAVTSLVKHPLYGKYMQRVSKHMAHDPQNSAHRGDLVEIEATRPLSRRKRWRVVRILRRALEADVPGPDELTGDAQLSEPEVTA
jgi:small subunit ribosomal protein S17